MEDNNFCEAANKGDRRRHEERIPRNNPRSLWTVYSSYLLCEAQRPIFLLGESNHLAITYIITLSLKGS